MGLSTPQPVAVDLELVSERLHVDARTVARKLHAPVGAREVDSEAPTTSLPFPSVTPPALHTPTTGYGTITNLALTEQLCPQAPPTVYSVYSQTPTQRPARLAKWWQGDAAHSRHTSVVERSREEVVRLRTSSRYTAHDEEHPLLGSGIYSFKHTPAGVLVPPCPLKAYVVPIDEAKTMLAVDEDVHPPKRTPLTMPDEIKHIEFRVREAEDHTLKLSMVVEFARPLVGWLILIVGVTCMAAVGSVIKMMSSDHVSGFVVGVCSEGMFLWIFFGCKTLFLWEYDTIFFFFCISILLQALR